MTRHESSAARRAAAGQPSKFAISPPLSSIAAAIALAIGLAAGPANALTLGPINVQSALGEPLRAEVDVSDITAAEAENLRLNIASAEAFRQAGIAYNQALTDVRTSLQRRADGRYVVRLAGTRPLGDPFVDLLLEANWSSGRIVRDYTLLLDPPSSRPTVAIAPLAPELGSVPTAPRPAPPAPVPAPPPAARAPEVAVVRPTPQPAAVPTPSRRPSPVAAPASPTISSSPAPAAPPSVARTEPSVPGRLPEAAAAPTADRQVTVQRGDTAGEIARANKPAEISLDQMLLALLRANPDAFIGGNVNRIRSGAVLNLPSAAQAGAVPPAEARQSVIAQSRDFGEYRRRLAENAPASQVAAADRQATGRLQASVEDRSAAPPTADRLTIAQGGTARGNDEALLKAREAQEKQARLTELSRNISDLSKLTAGASGAATAASAPGGAAPASPTASASANATPATVASAAVAASFPAPQPASASSDSGAQVGPGAASTPARSFIDTLRENQLVLVALGLALLLIVLLAYRIRERRKAPDAGESVFLESELTPDAFSDATGGESVDTHSSHSPVSSLSYSPSQLDAGDVDPVAEADVYLAYGRDLQAEEILREALRTNPDRTAIHLKLLEIHAKRRDIRAYEALATDVRGITHGTGPDWKRATEMGLELDPGNPLYGADDKPAPAFMPTVAPLDFDLNLDDETPAASLPPLPKPKPAGDSSFLDFDLGPLSGLPAAPTPDTSLDRLGDAFDADGESPHAIKLALARELQTLGDTEGARTLAEEVAVDGSGDLQAEAVRLLSQLH